MIEFKQGFDFGSVCTAELVLGKKTFNVVVDKGNGRWLGCNYLGEAPDGFQYTLEIRAKEDLVAIISEDGLDRQIRPIYGFYAANPDETKEIALALKALGRIVSVHGIHPKETGPVRELNGGRVPIEVLNADVSNKYLGKD